MSTLEPRPEIGDTRPLMSMPAHMLIMMLVVGCAASPTTTTTPGDARPSPPPTMPNSVPTIATPTVPPTNVTLVQGQRVAIASDRTLRFDNLVIEEIAGSPDGSYPAGSGLTLALLVEVTGQAEPLRRTVSLLSDGYTSQREAWFDDYRITLVDVQQPHNAARVALAVEQVSEHAPSGAPSVTRVERGQALPLDGQTTLVFVGNTTKRTSVGQALPLMLTVEYRVPGEEPDLKHMNLGDEHHPRPWIWRDFRFTIVEHAFDAWMRVSVERLQLRPAAIGG